MSYWLSYKTIDKQMRFFPNDPGYEMLPSPTSQKSRIRQLLILLSFYFNVTCSKKKKIKQDLLAFTMLTKEKGL